MMLNFPLFSIHKGVIHNEVWKINHLNVSGEIYETTLKVCSCPDYAEHNTPCKHIYRLFYELTQTPYRNPDIIFNNSDLPDVIVSLSDESRNLYLRGIFNNSFHSLCVQRSVYYQELIAASLLSESSDLPYPDLLNALTKDQIILALAKKNVSGFYPSWSKYKLIDWIISTQPKFLHRQFKKYTVVSFADKYNNWVSGVIAACKAFHFYIDDADLESGYTPYDGPPSK